ncbi:hypothetical protein E6O51_03780 [Pseudothauera rhizosphaerae]|uniref:Nucleotidyltransferase n=1 Tax=Pseudothauera rhizosphaerae TaxID=2565932 RepID=A0A4S4AWQ2_9RHOO|nr:hypothetical protein E6O51_03780 [Pseudothauera rhizosphaerae]
MASLLNEPDRLTELSEGGWDTLLRLARRANVMGRLAFATRGLPEKALPAPCRPHVTAALALADRQAHAVQWEIGCLRAALDEIGVPLVLLKGAAYLAADLPFARGRFFSDVDILVPRTRIDEVESVLLKHGWAGTHHDAYDQRYYRQWMHELPPMRHLRRGTVVDVHHRILPLTARFDPDPATMLERAMPVADDEGVFVLSPTDMLLHSATHLFHEGELPNGFRDLLDLDGLFRHFGAARPDFAAELDARAHTLHLEAPLAFARHQCIRLLKTPGIAPSRNGHVNRLSDALYDHALRPQHPLLDSPGSGFARWLLYVRAHWLRMPPHLLAWHLTHKAVGRFRGQPAENDV